MTQKNVKTKRGRGKTSKKSFSFAEYWEKNKDRINAKRRQRYRTDPYYREVYNRRFRKYYKERLAPIKVHGFKLEREFSDVPLKPRVVLEDGKMVVYRNTKEFADQISVTTATIRNWIKCGILPKPTVLNGRSWFSNEYVSSVYKVISEHPFDVRSRLRLKSLMRKAFDEAKIPCVWSSGV